MSTKCRYCGSVSYGSGCYHSPTGKHESEKKHEFQVFYIGDFCDGTDHDLQEIRSQTLAEAFRQMDAVSVE